MPSVPVVSVLTGFLRGGGACLCWSRRNGICLVSTFQVQNTVCKQKPDIYRCIRSSRKKIGFYTDILIILARCSNPYSMACSATVFSVCFVYSALYWACSRLGPKVTVSLFNNTWRVRDQLLTWRDSIVCCAAGLSIFHSHPIYTALLEIFWRSSLNETDDAKAKLHVTKSLVKQREIVENLVTKN